METRKKIFFKLILLILLIVIFSVGIIKAQDSSAPANSGAGGGETGAGNSGGAGATTGAGTQPQTPQDNQPVTAPGEQEKNVGEKFGVEPDKATIQGGQVSPDGNGGGSVTIGGTVQQNNQQTNLGDTGGSFELEKGENHPKIENAATANAKINEDGSIKSLDVTGIDQEKTSNGKGTSVTIPGASDESSSKTITQEVPQGAQFRKEDLQIPSGGKDPTQMSDVYTMEFSKDNKNQIFEKPTIIETKKDGHVVDDTNNGRSGPIIRYLADGFNVPLSDEMAKEFGVDKGRYFTGEVAYTSQGGWKLMDGKVTDSEGKIVFGKPDIRADGTVSPELNIFNSEESRKAFEDNGGKGPYMQVNEATKSFEFGTTNDKSSFVQIGDSLTNGNPSVLVATGNSGVKYENDAYIPFGNKAFIYGGEGAAYKYDNGKITFTPSGSISDVIRNADKFELKFNPGQDYSMNIVSGDNLIISDRINGQIANEVFNTDGAGVITNPEEPRVHGNPDAEDSQMNEWLRDVLFGDEYNTATPKTLDEVKNLAGGYLSPDSIVIEGSGLYSKYMDSGKINIFTTQDNPYSESLGKYLDSKGIPYKMIDVNSKEFTESWNKELDDNINSRTEKYTAEDKADIRKTLNNNLYGDIENDPKSLVYNKGAIKGIRGVGGYDEFIKETGMNQPITPEPPVQPPATGNPAPVMPDAGREFLSGIKPPAQQSYVPLPNGETKPKFGIEGSFKPEGQFIVIGSMDGCHYCNVLSPEIKKNLRDGDVAITFDIRTNPRLAQKFGIQGAPSAVIIDPSTGKVMSQLLVGPNAILNAMRRQR